MSRLKAGEDFRAIFEHATEGMYRTSPDGQFLHGNHAMAAILGYPSIEKLVRGVNDIASQVYVTPGRRDELLEELRQTGHIRDAESQIYRREGTRIWINENAWEVRDAEGRLLYFAGSVVDVTARKEAENRYRSLVENAIAGIYQITLDGRFVAVNPSMARILGYPSPEALVECVADIGRQMFADHGTYQRMLALLRSRERVENFEAQTLRADGTAIWVSANARLARDSTGEPSGYEGTLVEITDQKLARERLRHLATHDPLTGLPNRTLFIQRLAEALGHNGGPAARCAVLFIDLDEFKVVNDSLGHLVGDEMLVEVAGRLRESVPESDTVARHGGDEFTVLIEGGDCLARGIAAAERMLDQLGRPFRLRGQELYSNASIGIVKVEAHHRTTDAVLRDADTAMYRAKGQGKARYVVFDRKMHAQARARQRRETELRGGIERGEFVVHYQPIVRLADRRLVGFEALVRWARPGRRLLLPDRFIPLADETGLVLQIGWHVLRESCRQLRAWSRLHSHAAGLSVSVNLSNRQVSHSGLAARVRETLEETGLEPRGLHLEILETAFTAGRPAVAETLREIRASGIELHLDDFGTEYSSLGSLGSLPIDVLKIDRTFVGDLESNPRHRSLVRAMLHIAQDFGMRTVAEGVETARQAEYLRDMGCELAQGFLFDRALPPKGAEELIAREGAAAAG